MKFNERFAVHPADFQSYDTDTIREEFLVDEIFVENDYIKKNLPK